MISQFVQQEMDYLFLLSGLAFILLSAICKTIRRFQPEHLPWSRIVFFALAQSLYALLQMYRPMIGNQGMLQLFSLLAVGLSLFYLWEFVREGLLKLKIIEVGTWVYIPAVIIGALYGRSAGWPGLLAFMHCLVGAGAFGAVFVLFLTSRRVMHDRFGFMLPVVSMAGYGLSELIIPWTTFHPFSASPQEAFLTGTDIPVQLFSGFFALSMAVSVWLYYRKFQRSLFTDDEKDSGRWNGLKLSLALIVVLFGGWHLMQFTTEEVDREVRRDLMNHVGVAAAGLNVEWIRNLSGTAADLKNSDYGRLRKQLMSMDQASTDFRWLYLMFLEEEKKIPFVVDSIPEGEFGHTDPGVYYERPPLELYDVFLTGSAQVVGPYMDEYGSFLSGFAPVSDPSTGKLLAVLGVDINAAKWREMIVFYRLFPLSITLFISLILIGFFKACQDHLWSLRQIAASEKNLAYWKNRYELVTASSGQMVYEYDVKLGTVRWSGNAEEVLGYAIDEIQGNITPLLAFLHPEDRDRTLQHLERAGLTGESLDTEFRFRHKNGNYRWVHARGYLADEGPNQRKCLVGIIQDVTERKLMEKRLQELALVDELTGLNNRRQFFNLAAQQLKVAYRLKKKVVLIYIDLDRMKWINDTMGHREGDQAIKDTANILRQSFRSSDITARLGGDEFVGLCIATSNDAGQTIMARLRENLNAHNLSENRPYQLSLSFGMTQYDPENPCTLEELLAQGDRLMYEHKNEKKLTRT